MISTYKCEKCNWIGAICMNEIYVFDGGVGDVLFVYEDSIVLKHKGALNALAMGVHGDKTIFYSDLTSVQFKRAGLLAGHIQFSLMGGRESTGGVLAAASDENTITFNSDVNEMAEKVVAYIENKIRESRAARNAPVQVQAAPVSVADELIKFKQLLDMGVISQEEFDAKKAELMGGGQPVPASAKNNEPEQQEITYTLSISQKEQFFIGNSDIMVSIDGNSPRILKNGGEEIVVELSEGEHRVEFSFSFRKTAVIVYLNQNSRLFAEWDRTWGTIKVTGDANTNMMKAKKR